MEMLLRSAFTACSTRRLSGYGVASVSKAFLAVPSRGPLGKDRETTYQVNIELDIVSHSP